MSARENLMGHFGDSVAGLTAFKVVEAYRDEVLESVSDEVSLLVGAGPFSSGIMAVVNEAIENLQRQ